MLEGAGLKSIVKCFVAIEAKSAGAEAGGVGQLAHPFNISYKRQSIFSMYVAGHNFLGEQQQQQEAAITEAANERLKVLKDGMQNCIRALEKKQSTSVPCPPLDRTHVV